MEIVYEFVEFLQNFDLSKDSKGQKMLLFEANDLLGGNSTILKRALFDIECCVSRKHC